MVYTWKNIIDPLKLKKNNQPSWYCGVDFTVGIALCGIGIGIGGGMAWHGVALLYVPWFFAWLPLEWRHCTSCHSVFLCALALCIELRHFSLWCSIFLLAMATSLLPKQKRRICCAWQQWGNVSHCREPHWLCYQLWDGFLLLPQGPSTKQNKTINLCSVWHWLQHQWHVNIVHHVAHGDVVLLCHWHCDIHDWSCGVFCSGSKTEEIIHCHEVQWWCW